MLLTCVTDRKSLTWDIKELLLQRYIRLKGVLMWSRCEAEIHPLLEESGGLPKKNLIFILASLLQGAF